MPRKKWGFDTRELDPSIRPQDDFYHYVNRRWMKANPIPPNESHWGTFIKLVHETDKKLHSLVGELERKRSVHRGSPEQMVRDFYRSGMDMKRRNLLDKQPLDPLLKKVEAIQNVEDLVTVLAYLHRIGVGVAWGAGIDQDAKRSDRYALHLFQDGLGLPDRDYYLKNDAESLRVRTAYRDHVLKLFALMGLGAKEAQAARELHVRIETMLARISMNKVDRRDPEKTYHKFTIRELRKLAPGVDWDRYLKLLGTSVTTVIVMQPRFIKESARMLQTLSIAEWKTYLSWHIVNDFSGVLSARFIRQSFSFYGKALNGTPKLKPLWRRVLGMVNGSLGELIGQVYVKRYFPPEAKHKMNLLVDDLFTAFHARITSLTWMSKPTKRRALKKLRAINRKIGYPDKWKSYKGLLIKPDDYFGNLLRTNEYEHRRAMRKLRGPIDRGEWFMYPQTVNAYFAPNLNDIAFPAAILQPPFFSMDADDAVNYGSIGTVIGHEITHGFDNDGSKFDERGNLKNWWKPSDRKHYDAKAKKIERQYNRYTVADGVRVNGKLTLGENIADLGGLSIAFDAYQLQLARTGRKAIENLTPEQRFFLSFAVFERINVRPEAQKVRTLTDPHAPGITRINGPVSNCNEFYKAFGVTKKDKLYRPPSERETVW